MIVDRQRAVAVGAPAEEFGAAKLSSHERLTHGFLLESMGEEEQ